MPLNQAQTNALTTTLRMLEERCDQVEALLGDDRQQHRLIQIEHDVPPDVQRAVRAELRQVRAGIAQLAAMYQLHARPQSAWRAIDALLVTSWTDLEDTRPAKLRRYGPVDPAVIAHLDAPLEQLMTHIERMRALGNAITTSETASASRADDHGNAELEL